MPDRLDRGGARGSAAAGGPSPRASRSSGAANDQGRRVATLLAIVADTHLPRGRRAVPQACLDAIARADLVVHAGDIAALSALEEIERIGPPVQAIHGNVDAPELRRTLPERLELRLEGVVIGVIHDPGAAAGRVERLRAQFPRADAVIFGHTHRPEHRRASGFQIFNPGSPTERRRSPRRSMGVARVRDGRITFRHLAL